MNLLRSFTTMTAAFLMVNHQWMGVKAFAPSTPSSQQATTTLKPPPAPRPCHDINSDDPMDVLGLTKLDTPTLTRADIKRAYKSLVTFYHPDAIANLQTKEEKDEASSRFAKINAAYREVLQYVDEIERQRREHEERLARIQAMRKNDPFNWAIQPASMNKHETAELRFEFAPPSWKRGGECLAESTSKTRKVHIRRSSSPVPVGTVDPFNWATAVVTGW